MYLIHTENIKLQYFPDRPERYAILSHTWEPDEISFREFVDSSRHIQGTAGYRKIQRCCEQARQDTFDYIWIDTVCINKESSAELSEAINSMWDWYQHSAICYVFLSDYDVMNGSKLDQQRYWTRSWTLQELIAPKDVTIYDKEWRLVGTKQDMAHKLCTITGIPKRVMTDASQIFSCSIAQRFSWAASRNATRVEDRTYSLLGIFQINMPLIYGEREKAFIRLQKEIISQSDDRSILAWRLTSQVEISSDVSTLLAHSVSDFVNCRDITLIDATFHGGAMKLTSRGLRLEIPVAPDKEGLIKALLGFNTYREGLYIVLKRLTPPSGVNIFERHDPSGRLGSMPRNDAVKLFQQSQKILAPSFQQALFYKSLDIESLYNRVPPAICIVSHGDFGDLLPHRVLTCTFRTDLFDYSVPSRAEKDVKWVDSFRYTYKTLEMPLHSSVNDAPTLRLKPRDRTVFKTKDFLLVMILSSVNDAKTMVAFSFDGYELQPKLKGHHFDRGHFQRWYKRSDWRKITRMIACHESDYFSRKEVGRSTLVESLGWAGNVHLDIRDQYTENSHTVSTTKAWSTKSDAQYILEFSIVQPGDDPYKDQISTIMTSVYTPVLLILFQAADPIPELFCYMAFLVALVQWKIRSPTLHIFTLAIFFAISPSLATLVVWEHLLLQFLSPRKIKALVSFPLTGWLASVLIDSCLQGLDEIWPALKRVRQTIGARKITLLVVPFILTCLAHLHDRIRPLVFNQFEPRAEAEHQRGHKRMGNRNSSQLTSRSKHASNGHCSGKEVSIDVTRIDGDEHDSQMAWRPD